MIFKHLFFKFFLILLILLPINIWSQNVLGKIVNSENSPLEFASVSIMTLKDSVLIEATSTNKLGEFKLTNLLDISSTNELNTPELNKISKKEHVYHVIIGTYGNPANAKTKLNELRALGFKATALRINQTGLTRVSIGNFNNELDARNNLLEIKKTIEKDAWLLIEEKESNEAKFIERISKIEYLFQVHLIGFKIFQKPINFNGKTLDMGVITLDNDNLLDEVIITLVTPFSIKKDTVSYNTQAYKVKMDDTVEDLLKKLPGIEVDASGKITAQGETVTKIYVDGKEFFSGDPAIATKNLPANAIKKIEVIDEKSEKYRVTGINDFDRKKVINLELKDDNKRNDFGKLQGGYGTDDRYLTGLNYNRFTSKLQASVIGKYNNVNNTGSDISELISFDSGGGINSDISSGFLTTGLAGLNLGYELKKDQNVNADYFYNYNNATSGDILTNRTEFISGLEIISESKSSSENTSNNQNLNFSYRDHSNKLSSLNINGSTYINNNQGTNIITLDKYNGEKILDLQSIGKINSESKGNSGNLSIRYTKRLNEKSKRNFSISGNFNASKSSKLSTNNQLNNFNISDPDNAYQTIEEVKREQELQTINLGLFLSYVEPIAKNHFLEFKSYIESASIDDNVNQIKLENEIIQNPLIYDQYYKNSDIEGGVFYNYDNEKVTIYLGGLFTNQNQKFGLENEQEYNNRYTNFNTEMSVMYRPKMGKSLNFQIKEYVKLPSLFQLTPVINDFNSLYIYKGNQFLTPENKISTSVRYNNYNFKNGFNFFSVLSYSHISNSIVNSEFTNQLGVRTTTYENFGDKNNIKLGVKLGKRLNSLGLRYNISLDGDYSEYLSIINANPNETQSKNGTLGFSIENNNKDKIDAIIGATWNKNYTTFSNGNNADRDYLQQNYYTKVDWNITDKLNLNSQFKYDIYSDSNFGNDNQSVPIWNASISYMLLKTKNLNLNLTAVDILNKNIGLIRTSTDNYFEEVHQEVLGNYYMLSLTYNLNGN